jgi:hypothetical protein
VSEQPRRETSAISALQGEFQRGLDGALDPANASAVQGGQAVTTPLSRWLHMKCPTCQHTFRTGDLVEISPDGKTVRHQSPSLPCATGAVAETAPKAALSEFFAGLDAAWPPPPDMQVIRLEEGHPLLAPPVAGFERHACKVCDHTLRLHDSVVLCPCSPTRPLCSAAIHRDPLHGLHCLEAWNPGGTRKYCPVTSRVLDG